MDGEFEAFSLKREEWENKKAWERDKRCRQRDTYT